MRRAWPILLAVLAIVSLTSIANSQSRTRQELRDEITAKRAELDALEEQFLAPAERDKLEWADLLKEPNTGVIRLLPRDKFDSNLNRNQKTLTIRGSGAYYSFTRLTHDYGYGSDIEFSNGELSTGFAGADYGMLVNVGDVRLQDISLDNSSESFFARYEPAKFEPDARVEQRRFAIGTTIDGHAVKRNLPLELGSTYLLRSINFDESDVLVIFRVTRRDSDGSIILAWKLLNKYTVPKLARNNENN